MIAIKDMKMPKSCSECRFCSRRYDYLLGQDVDTCEAEKVIIPIDINERRTIWCPLREVKK